MEAPTTHQTVKPRELKCQRCGAKPRSVQTILDTRAGRTVRVFECECGERIWDD